MKYPELSSAAQRMQAAQLTGAVRRLSYGRGRDVPLEQALAELAGITTDPIVLGDVLGVCLVYAESDGADAADYGRAVRMLRAAGADEQTATAKAVWLRWRFARNAQGGLSL